MKLSISSINKLLITRFGIPKRKITKTDPVDALIATILSQNTTDINSYKAYKNLKDSFKNWYDVASVKQRIIEQNIRVGGLANQKSKAIKAILKKLLEKRGEITLDYLKDLPNDEVQSELVKFNGVGIKTASCVLLFSLHRNVCPVDTHVHRVVNRIGLVNTKSPDKTFEILNRKLPTGVAHSFHTNLIKLGRDICKAGKPICSDCPLLKICSYSEKNMLPVPRSTNNDFLLLDNV